MRRAGFRALLAAYVAAVLLIPSAQATPGALDPTFGAGGKVTTAIGLGASGSALALQPDGKLVAAGYSDNGKANFALVRYKPNGSLDTSFNGTGKVTTTIGSGSDIADALVLQPDGRLAAAGESYNGSDWDFALARYNPDGSLDTSFKGTGKVTTAIGSGEDVAYSLALQPDGKLVAAGDTSDNGSNFEFALARYNPGGSLDTSFNGTGKVTTAIGIGPTYDQAFALVLQPNGRLVVAGRSYNGSNFDFALARYNPNGSLDTSFNGTGRVTTAMGPGDDLARALVLQPDGKLVAAGLSRRHTRNRLALARYNPNGSLDASFNGTGKVITAIGPTKDAGAFALVLQPDGRLAAAGTSWNGSNFDFALVRFNPNGSLDVSFNGTGKVTTAFGPGDDGASGLVLQPDGKLVAAGGSFNGDKYVIALARYRSGTLVCVVPSVKGKTLAAARRAIGNAHCSVGKVTKAFSSKVKKGRVISQKPGPGKKLAAGSKVKLTVSKGKKR
jgi:uncharacterized delta-60 repeat protein